MSQEIKIVVVGAALVVILLALLALTAGIEAFIGAMIGGVIVFFASILLLWLL